MNTTTLFCKRRKFLKLASAAALCGGCRMSPAKCSKLRIAHLTDPQLGFGNEFQGFAANYAADLKRCEKAIELVNAMKPDLALVTGDMVNVAADLTKDWPRLLEMIKVPVAVAPGNHDMGKSITRENLDRFRAVFGRDYGSLDVCGWRVIFGNTQYWRKTELVDEQARYEAWLKAELVRAREMNGRVILAGHVPPFYKTFGEEDSYNNYPKAGRAERMKAYEDAGVRFLLAGHTHTMSVRRHKELTILIAETTSRNFDKRPFGFRMFETENGVDYSYEFVPVG